LLIHVPLKTTIYPPASSPSFLSHARVASLLVVFGLIALPSLVLAAPDINTKTKNATFPLNNDNSARPGDTIHYSISVGNNGAAGTTDATGVQVADPIDSNSTFVNNSAKVSANAIAHAYNAAGNTQLIVNAANGVLNGVHDIDLVTPDASLLVTAGTFATSAGGSVTIAANGSFTYTPQTGDQNLTDTFSYTVTDGDGLPSTGLVSINLGARVWYVDSTYAGANGPEDGSNVKPFNALSDISGATGPDAAGDIIFIVERAGDYDGNLTLLNNQLLYGSGAALTVNTIVINAAGGPNTTMVTTAASTPSITLGGGTGNTVTGFTIGNTTGAKITGVSFGTLTISNVTMSGTGPALLLNNGTVNGTIDSLTSTSSTSAVSLTTIAGTLAITTGAISGATADDFFVSAGTATISYGGTITNSSGRSVTVQNKTGGTVTFSGAITDTAGSTGINLATNTGATIIFRGGLSLTTTTSAAFTATGGGTVNVCATNDCAAGAAVVNTITTTTGTALNVANTTIGTSGLTFRSINVTGNNTNPASGIILTATGANGLKITGNGGACTSATPTCTGGTIQGTGSHGVALTSVSNIEFNLFSIHNTGDHGIFGDGVNNFTLRDSYIFAFGNTAGGGVSEDAMHFESTNLANTAAGHGLTGTVIIQRDTIGPDSAFVLSPNPPGPENKGIVVRNHNDLNFTMTVTGTKFFQLSNDGIDAEASNDSDAGAGKGAGTINVDGSTADGINTFSQINGRAVNFQQPIDSVVARIFDLTIKNNTFDHIGIGGRWLASGRGTMNARYNNNTMTFCYNDAIRSESDAVNAALTPHASVNATVNGNTMGGGSIFISLHRGALSNIAFTNNTAIGGTPAASGGCASCTGVHTGINLRSDRGSALAIDITGNTGTADGSLAFAQSALDMQASDNGGGASTICANVGGAGALKNTFTENPDTAGQQVISIDPANAGTAITIQGGPGGSPGTENFLISNNTLNGTNKVAISSPSRVPSGVGVDCVTSTPLQFSPGGVEKTEKTQVAEVTSTAVPAVIVPAASSATIIPAAPVEQASKARVLNQGDLDSIVADAIARWEATGLNDHQLETLRSLRFEVADLPSIYLGEAEANRIRVSSNAGGNGWFIASARDDAQFGKETSATRRYSEATGAPAGRVDLLTTIMHEMGHAIGLPDSYAEKDRDSLMYGFLTKGERRLPRNGQAVGAIPGSVTGSHFLNLPVTIGTLNPGTTVSMKFDATVNAGFGGGNITNTANITGTGINVNTNTTTVPVHVPPAVATNPTNQTTDVTKNATFTAAATGFPVPTVQWFVHTSADGVGVFNPVPGGTNPTLTITNATAGQNGNIYHAVFTNTAGTATTTDATLTVNPLPTVSPTTLPDSTVGILYNQTITASDGTGSKTMNVTNYNAGGTGLTAPTASPDTLTFNSTPNAAGTVSFDLVATDTVGGSSPSQHYSFVINPAVTLSPTTLPDSTVGVAYTQVINGVGGTGSKTMSVTNYSDGGTGLLTPTTSANTITFNSTPTAPGTVSFDASAVDTLGATSGTQHYTFVINGVVTLSPTSLPDATVGFNYTQSITASGGTGNKTMLVSAYSDGGTGLGSPSASANTVTFNSTPSAAGTVNFDLKATDTVGAFASQHYTVTVAPPCDNPATVTSILDDGSAGTLRFELNKVCDGGVVNFQAGLTGTITLTTGQLEIDKNVTVTGPGAAVITVTANNTGRVFNVQSGKTATISGLTVAGGNVLNANQGGLGGGIYVNSTAGLTLTNCVVSGNKALDTNGAGGGAYNGGTLILLGTTFNGNQSTLEGGAIRNDGTLSLTDSTLDNNTAGTTGGAIQNGGSLTIYGSTLSNNTAAGDGGAVRNDGTQFTITNSTLSGNKTTGVGADGGAILNATGKTLAITNATIVKNTAGHDGGGINNGGTLTIKNSIVALNTATNSAPDLKGDANVDYSLLGDSTGAGTITGANNLSGDPKLNDLGNYGGLTLTHQPKIDSPVLDAGNNAFVTAPPFPMPFKDQRGFDRIVDSPDVDASATVDIGAVEANYSINVVSGSTPQSATVGTAFSIPLAAEVSESGNAISGVLVTWTAPASEPTGSFPGPTNVATATTDGTGIATPPTFTAGNIPGSYTVSATATGYAGSADYSLTNTAGAATQLVVTAPANATAGSPFTITVTAEDSLGNIDPNYTGTVHFTKSDPGAGSAVPTDYTFTVGDAGTRTFTNGVTYVTSGTQTVTATDTVTNTITGSANTLVSAATATHFSVVAPASATAAVGFNFSVTALDQFDNTATGYVGTVHFTSTDGAANLPSNYTFTGADAGAHSFSATLNTAGNQTITSTDTVNNSITGTSGTVSVSAGSATHFSVTAPASTTAGNAFNMTVTALDAANNIATGYTSTVHFTSTDSQAALPVDYTFLPADNGSKTFSITLKTAGNQTITATDTVNAAINGTSSTINVLAGAATHYALTAPAGAVPGTPFNFTVTALDQFNNTATSYLGTAHFTSSNAATVPGDYTFVAGDNGSHIFSATLNNPGNQSITATDTVTNTITGTANIAGGQAPAITSADNATFKVGTAGTFTVTTTGFPTNASMAITETGALPGNLTFTNNNDGTATLAGTPNAGTGGTYSISIKASNGIAPDATQSFTLTVQEGPTITSADHTTFAEGSAGTFTVTTTGFPTGPSMSITRTGNLPAGVTFVNNNDGTATLSGTPGPLTGGTYPFTIGANNGVTATVNQNFVLTVVGITPSPTPTATATATATPTATATATPTATATATATPTASATATATASPSATPTATPTASATPAQALNISTRLRVDTGDKVMIGGFIITGNMAKPVVLRGIGPSLTGAGLPAASLLNDPVLELHGASGALIVSNDNWKDSPQKNQIQGTIYEPTDDRESVIVATLPPAAYTVVLKGANNTSGIGLVEVYDNDSAVDSELANISTRGFVQTGDEVMIGGFVLGGTGNPTNIAVRALGPSLASAGLANLLADPTLELHNANGTLMISNDDWQSDAVSAAQLTAHGLALPNAKESGIFASLAPPGQFTAIVTGKNGGIGIALVEIYNVK
jgi:Bacterial Ig domain/Right handed beta helix region/Immunoglobulin I-set domain